MWFSHWIFTGCLLLVAIVRGDDEELDYSWATPTKPKDLSDRAQISFSCLTPNYNPGNCVPVPECPELVSVLQNRPLSNRAKQFLNLSICYYYENQLPVVCCTRPSTGGGGQPVQSTRPPNRHPTHKPSTAPYRPPVNPTPTRPTPTRPQTGGGGGSTAIDHPNRNLIPEDCGRDSQSRIFGGTEANLGEFPWAALLKYRSGGRDGFYCGGVLISDRYVLTASHCVKIDGVRMIAVRIGEHNINTDPDCKEIRATNQRVCADAVQEIAVEEEIPHPQYNKNDRHHYNDIALVRLRNSVRYNDYAQPICLPFGPVGQEDLVGKKLWVAGWGKTEKRSESDVKLKVNVSVTNFDQCFSKYRANLNIDYDKQICAGGETGKDSCNGDSGGPLMTLKQQEDGEVRWYSAGVVAFGPSQCGMQGWPGVYSRTSHYLRWILDTMRP